jgi:methionyl-tRNA formyltransferase
MGLEGLEDLIKKNYPPEFVVIHKDYELTKLNDVFYIPIEKLCSDYDIPLIKTGKINDIKNNIIGYDLGICIGFMEIIRKDIFEIPEFGILNLHCGKLPFYRGRAPISRTIMDGNKTLTITLHKMDEGVDSGEILLETEIEIENSDDVNSLYKKCCSQTSGIIIKGIEKLITRDKNIFSKQDLSLKPKSNKKISEEERKINWEWNIEKIHNFIRALTSPYPCAYAEYENKKYNFLKSEIFSEGICNARQTGEIYFVDEDYLLINSKDGLIRITDIQNENNQKINFEEVFKQKGIFK